MHPNWDHAWGIPQRGICWKERAYGGQKCQKKYCKKRKLKLFRAPQIRNIGKAGERQPTKRILLKTVCKGGAHQGVIASVKDCSSGSSEMQPNATSRYNTEVAFYQKLKFLTLLVQNDQFLAIQYWTARHCLWILAAEAACKDVEVMLLRMVVMLTLTLRVV